MYPAAYVIVPLIPSVSALIATIKLIILGFKFRLFESRAQPWGLSFLIKPPIMGSVNEFCVERGS
jgi:hypothetical protein